MTLKDKLIHAVTEYDRKQLSKRSYNPYALAQYFERIDEIMADVERGASLRAALLAGFSDRLLDHCLKAIGEKPFTKSEKDNGAWSYKPVTT